MRISGKMCFVAILLVLSGESSEIAIDDAKAQFQFTFTPQVSSETTDDSTTFDYGVSLSRKTMLGTLIQIEDNNSTTKYDGGTNLYRRTVIFSLEQPLLRSASTLVNREPITAAELQLIADANGIG